MLNLIERMLHPVKVIEISPFQVFGNTSMSAGSTVTNSGVKNIDLIGTKTALPFKIDPNYILALTSIYCAVDTLATTLNTEMTLWINETGGATGSGIVRRFATTPENMFWPPLLIRENHFLGMSIKNLDTAARGFQFSISGVLLRVSSQQDMGAPRASTSKIPSSKSLQE